MSGPDGKKNMIKLTWEQFQSWQRWDEYPERKFNPPITVDMTFFYQNKIYYLDSVNHEYAILTEQWETLASDNNFLKLLNKPIKEWDEKSFHELLGEMYFKD